MDATVFITPLRCTTDTSVVHRSGVINEVLRVKVLFLSIRAGRSTEGGFAGRVTMWTPSV